MTASLASKWFEEVPRERAGLVPGQFCHVPIPYTVQQPLFVNFLSYDAAQSNYLVELLWKFEGRDPWDHAPVKELRLRQNEECVAVTFKRRDVIILSTPIVRHGTEMVLALPVYSFRDVEGQDAEEFRDMVAAGKECSCFYLPKYEARNKHEGFVCFGQIQPVAAVVVAPNLKQYRLPGPAMDLLQNFLWRFLTGKMVDSDIEELIA